MICTNCGQHLDGPAFGPIGESWCWDCWSGERLPEDERRPTEQDIYHHQQTYGWRYYFNPVYVDVVPAQEAGP